MSVYGFFQPSVLGMEAQSHSLGAIANNITNIRTGGFKRTDVQFATVLSNTLSSQPGAGAEPAGTTHSDFGGVRPQDYARIDLQGAIEATDRKLDVAIDGNGFFVVNSRLDGAGESLYGRDGRFSVVNPLTGAGPSINHGYLVDKNGFYVQGWASRDDGTFPSDQAGLGAMRVDSGAFGTVGTPTAAAELALNLPATAAPGASETYTIDVFDSAGNRQDLRLQFTREPTANTWHLDATGAPGDAITFDDTAAAKPLVFGADGYLASPAAYTIGVAHAGGTTSRFTLDVSAFTQFGDEASPFSYNRDGFLAGELESIEFDNRGHVIGVFASGMAKPLYKLAMADFANVDGLDGRNGNLYAESPGSGEAELGTAGNGGFGAMVPNAHELSNVDLAQEFSRMITTQNAYNASATSFRTADEMTEIARDLKR